MICNEHPVNIIVSMAVVAQISCKFACQLVALSVDTPVSSYIGPESS